MNPSPKKRISNKSLSKSYEPSTVNGQHGYGDAHVTSVSRRRMQHTTTHTRAHVRTSGETALTRLNECSHCYYYCNAHMCVGRQDEDEDGDEDEKMNKHGRIHIKVYYTYVTVRVRECVCDKVYVACMAWYGMVII